MLRYALLVAMLTGSSPACLADDVDPMFKDQLRLKIPNFFSWDYSFEPEPGKRIWLRIDDKTFIERYPSGKENKFAIVGRITVDDIHGTLAQIAEGTLQVFIPDKESKPMYLKMRGDEKGEWGHMGEIKKFE